MPPFPIPLDVVGIIVDHLAALEPDLSTVKSCSLASRALVPLCQRHMFATVILSINPADPPTCPHPIVHFDELLSAGDHGLHAAPGFEIAPHVRKLEVVCRSNLPKSTTFDVLNRLHGVRDFAWGFLGGRTPGAVQRYIDGRWQREWGQIPARLRTRATLFMQRSALVRLELFGTHALLAALFADLPHLRELSARDICCGAAPDDPRPTHRIKLRALDVGPRALGLVRPLMLVEDGPIDITTVAKMSLHVGDGQEVRHQGYWDTIGTILGAPAALEDLTLVRQHSWIAGTGVYSAGDLLLKLAPSCILTLRRVRIEIRASAGLRLDEVCSGLAGELSAMAHRNVLEALEVQIVAHLHSDVTLDVAAWATLDGALSRGFPHLRSVNIGFKKGIFAWQDGASTRNLMAEAEALFVEQFVWCRAHVRLTTTAETFIEVL